MIRQTGFGSAYRDPHMASAPDEFLACVKLRVDRAGVFAHSHIADGVLVCQPGDPAMPAAYRLEQRHGRPFVSLVTPDRWLSESIEADLMHTGDDLEELIDEELAELGHPGPRLTVTHFRSDDMLYTFRSPIPVGRDDPPDACDTATRCLLAYEAAFRQLGDMQSPKE